MCACAHGCVASLAALTCACALAEALAAAASADAVVLVVGIDQSIESEGHDRTDIGLPGYQNLLIQEVAGVLSWVFVLRMW